MIYKKISPIDVFICYSNSINNGLSPYGDWSIHKNDMFEVILDNDKYYIKYLHNILNIRPVESHPIYNRIVRCFKERDERCVCGKMPLFECSCGLCEKYMLSMLYYGKM